MNTVNGDRRGLFHRSGSPEHVNTVNTNTHITHSGGLFHRNTQDPSIINAKQRVADAEVAEKNADRALHEARAAVREAREDIKRLEREAAEE